MVSFNELWSPRSLLSHYLSGCSVCENKLRFPSGGTPQKSVWSLTWLLNLRLWQLSFGLSFKQNIKYELKRIKLTVSCSPRNSDESGFGRTEWLSGQLHKRQSGQLPSCGKNNDPFNSLKTVWVAKPPSRDATERLTTIHTHTQISPINLITCFRAVGRKSTHTLGEPDGENRRSSLCKAEAITTYPPCGPPNIIWKTAVRREMLIYFNFFKQVSYNDYDDLIFTAF